MIKVKTTVMPKNLVIMAACANVAEAMGIEVVVTSGKDSKHMMGSKHYAGNALDIRSKNFKSYEDKLLYLDAVMERLGEKYQGILEFVDTPNEHFHIEYDPD